MFFAAVIYAFLRSYVTKRVCAVKQSRIFGLLFCCFILTLPLKLFILYIFIFAYLQPHPGKGGLGSLPHPPPLLQQHRRTKRMGIKQPQPQILSIILLTQPHPPQQIIKSMISNQRLQLSFKKPKQFIKFLLENIFDRCFLLSLHITFLQKYLLRFAFKKQKLLKNAQNFFAKPKTCGKRLLFIKKWAKINIGVKN